MAAPIMLARRFSFRSSWNLYSSTSCIRAAAKLSYCLVVSLGQFVRKMVDGTMNGTLVEACHMFMVPATILVAALGLGGTEAWKTLVCLIGLTVSTVWLYRLYRWTGLSGADQHTAFALAYIFFAAA